MSAGGSLAALLVGLAVWLWRPGVRRRLDTVGLRAGRRFPLLVPASVIVVVGGGAVVAGLPGVVVGIGVGAAVATGTWLARAGWRARLQANRTEQVAHAAQLLAGQLRIGAVPSRALQTVAQDCPWLERPAATMAIGGDLARALHEVAGIPGRGQVASLARAWELGERTGAPIAGLATQVDEQLRADRRTAQAVAAELGGPRATARLLAALPLVGIVMGRAAGGDPLHFLLHTLPGQACLSTGLVLACVGVLWTEQMAHSAQEV